MSRRYPRQHRKAKKKAKKAATTHLFVEVHAHLGPSRQIPSRCRVPRNFGGPISRNDIPHPCYGSAGTMPGQVGYWSRMDDAGWG